MKVNTHKQMVLQLLKYLTFSMCRITIFGKAKIGTLDDHFARNQKFGLIIAF